MRSPTRAAISPLWAARSSTLPAILPDMTKRLPHPRCPIGHQSGALAVMRPGLTLPVPERRRCAASLPRAVAARAPARSMAMITPAPGRANCPSPISNHSGGRSGVRAGRCDASGEFAARAEALKMAQDRLEELAADGRISPEALAVLQARHEDRSGRLPRATSDGLDVALVAAELRSELIAAEREYIYQLLRDGRITDEARRRIERELDLEEAGIACKKEGGVEPPL